MDLKTTYLGLELSNPIVCGASPLATDLDAVKRVADAGVGAIVMHSIFEEQIERETMGMILDVETSRSLSAEATSFFPDVDEFRMGPAKYLEQVRKVKDAAGVPVIASLNGTTASGWLEYAKEIALAGADALELNVYYVAARAGETGADVERRTIDVVRSVRSSVRIPVSVKLSPFFSSVRDVAAHLDAAGADGFVLFNRFCQPDLDVEDLKVVPSLALSDSSELLLRLRWIAILAGNVRGSLAVSGGVHAPLDAVKAVLAGAHAVQVVSALLQKGPAHARALRDGLAEWGDRHGYASVAQMRGALSQAKCPNPAEFERANYMKALSGWRS
jgi:dihydroorotate dehydrogenase (fumarate)